VSEEDLGNVSIVGTGMQNSPGYASDMFRALANAGVNIEMITTSQIRITCIISRSQVHEAVKVLHKAFQLDQQV
jgi:aspartate kinase